MKTQHHPSHPTTKKCKIYQDAHYIERCPVLLAKPINERSATIAELKHCFGCLRPMTTGHNTRSCRNRKTCSVCNKPYPTCLHGFRFKSKDVNGKYEKLDPQTKEFVPEVESRKVATTHVVDQDGEGIEVNATRTRSFGKVISMCVVPICISHPSTNTKIVTMAMLDSCSQATFVSNSLVQRLGIKGRKTSLSIKTINGTERTPSSVISDLFVSTASKILPTKTLKLPNVYTKDNLPVDSSEIATKEKLKQWSYLDPISNHVGDRDDIAVELLIV